MSSCDNVEIQVKNEAIHDDPDDDDSNVQYEEYIFSPYNVYEQEEEKHIPLDETVSNDEETPKTSASHNDEARKYSHYKEVIIKHMMTYGWSSQSYERLMKKVRRAPEHILKHTLDYVQTRIKEAQENVYQECDSLCFTNISEWLEVFRKMDVPKHSYYEPAIILSTIINNETLPKAENLQGVDLKAIYSFICNGLFGLPQPNLDPVTAKFLANEFEALIEEVNTEDADHHTILMKQKLQQSLPFRMNCTPPSLDPLWLTENTVVNDYILPKTTGKRKPQRRSSTTQQAKTKYKKKTKIKKEEKVATMITDAKCKPDPDANYNAYNDDGSLVMPNSNLQIKNELNEI